MNARGLRGPPLRGYVRNSRRRKMVLNVDLNMPPCENQDQEGSSAHANSQDVQPGQQGGSVPHTPIDVEAFDDDVVISSPWAFAQAKHNSRRNRGRNVVVDVDSEERTLGVVPNSRNKRRRVPSSQTIISCDNYVNLEGASNSTLEIEEFFEWFDEVEYCFEYMDIEEDIKKQNVQVSCPPPPPQESKFRCPVCMGPLVEEMSTKCGHVFCKACINAAIAAQGKCPTCRKILTKKDTIRVYLPAAN